MFSALSKTDIVMQMSSTDAVLPGEIIHIDSYIAGSRSSICRRRVYIPLVEDDSHSIIRIRCLNGRQLLTVSANSDDSSSSRLKHIVVLTW